MKHILFTGAVALALALPQPAKANDGCFCFGFGFRVKACVKLNVCFQPCCPTACDVGVAGPWYAYFPQPCHYPAAPMAMYPHWPQQPMAAAPMGMPANAYNPYNSGLHNVSYYGGVPSYWYGR